MIRFCKSCFFILSFCVLLLLVPRRAAALSIDLPSINQTAKAILNVSGNASISNDGLDLTKDTYYAAAMGDNCGQAVYKEPLHLYDNASGEVISFTTHFSFLIYSPDRYADGITFFLAPVGTSNFTNGSAIGLPLKQHSFVAVEFDTFPNYEWDSPNFSYSHPTHVGINVHNMSSVKFSKWDTNISNENVRYEAYISYGSGSRIFGVNYSNFVNGSTFFSSIQYLIDLRDYLPERVIFGFTGATGLHFEKNTIMSWQFNSTTLRVDEKGKKNKRKKNKASVVGLLVGLCVIVGVLVLIGFGLWRKRRGVENQDFAIELSMENEFETGSGPKKFSYRELTRATHNFSEANKLGEGGFGGVFKGFLKETNTHVAVKRISKGSEQGIKEYASEVNIISRIRHRNLVQLIGWCHEKQSLLLVYEFMENGSLDFHLFKGKSLLTWTRRYGIAKGLAAALLYLHEEWEKCVVHRDVKSSNVMLDSNFNSRLGDFGLARFFDHEKGLETTAVAGTLGYMAPEICLVTGKSSKESDVYSFGIVALEIACGRRAIDRRVEESQVNLLQWVWDLYGLGKLLQAADARLADDFGQQEMERLMIVGLWCAHPDYSLRPSIRQAINVLNFEAPLPVLPAKLPEPTYLAPALSLPLYSDTGSSESSQGQSSSYTHNTGSSHFSSASAASSLAVSFLHPKNRR